MLGHKVLEIHSDGKEFLESENWINADIVLMDIEMPQINGIETTKLTLWQCKTISVIAITSFVEKANLAEFIGAGFKGCVFKDNIYNELSNALDHVSNGRFFFPSNMNLSK